MGLHGSDAFEIQADLVQGQYGRRGAALENRIPDLRTTRTASCVDSGPD